jgi:phosphatidylglycerophosphatase A
MINRLALLVATVLGIGRVPFAPGTFGSLPGIAVTLLARASGPWWLEGAIIVLLFAVGVWAATLAERHLGGIDPGPVVIDEVVGMMITVLFLPLSPAGLAAGFVVFRVCDVLKPFPAGRFEQFPGGLGVMSDDVMAGVWGYAIMRGLIWLAPAWMLA